MPCDKPGHVHEWPTEGTLEIARCERTCGYCPTREHFAHASSLIRHVKRFHAGPVVEGEETRADGARPTHPGIEVRMMLASEKVRGDVGEVAGRDEEDSGSGQPEAPPVLNLRTKKQPKKGGERPRKKAQRQAAIHQKRATSHNNKAADTNVHPSSRARTRAEDDIVQTVEPTPPTRNPRKRKATELVEEDEQGELEEGLENREDRAVLVVEMELVAHALAHGIIEGMRIFRDGGAFKRRRG